MSIEYHKIQSVFLRDPASKFKAFLEGQYTEPEFAYLAGNEWELTEKVDGTNIRVAFGTAEASTGYRRFDGRGESAQIPSFLLARLEEIFPHQKLTDLFWKEGETVDVTLYGEGYGAKIQKGGERYIPAGVDFILFDVRIGGLWLKSADVTDIAEKLGVQRVPIVGHGTLAEAIAMTRAGFASRLPGADRPAEGLVCRPAVELLTRRGERVITKVKTRDFAR